jgi:hypothetical protein
MRTLLMTSIFLTVAMCNFMETGFAMNPDLSMAGGKTTQNSKIHLFNGKDLSGWYTFIKGTGRNIDPKGIFKVQNGLIRISGEEFGCITTNNEYESYKLEVEFKWGELTFAPRVNNARDSGILLHSTGEDGDFFGTWMRSIECQLIEGGTGDMLVVGDKSANFSITCPVATEMQEQCYVFNPGGNPATIYDGRINWYGRDPEWKDVKGFRGIHDVEKPVGKWNKIVCIAKGKEISIFLNGILVNRAIAVQPTKGRIQVQSEGAEIFIRRFDLTPL